MASGGAVTSTSGQQGSRLPHTSVTTRASGSSEEPTTSTALSNDSKWSSIRPWNSQLSLQTKEVTSVSVTFILATEPTTTKGSEASANPTLRVTGPSSSTSQHSSNGPTASTSSSSAVVSLGSSIKGIEGVDQDDQDEPSPPSDDPATQKPPPTILTQILQRQKALQTKVNSVNWQRVLIRIDENGDEAVIIVYGLMPGREYDIDLAIVQPQALPGVPQLEGQASEEAGVSGEGATSPGNGAMSIGRRQVLTFDAAVDNSDPDSTTEIYSSTDLGDNVSNSSNSDPPQALSTPSTSPSRTIPNTPPATPPPAAHSSLSASTSTSSTNPSQQSPAAVLPTLEDRLYQLRQKLHTVNAERETLASSLKSARRESNKKDAALKAEIEALKRSSEKFSANEVRQRQKNLALQESVKRAQAATRETQQLVRDVESEVPEVLKEKEKKEKEHETVKQEAEKVGKEKKERVEEEKKRREGMKNELAALTNKLEKLNAKKERQETVVIPSLEDKLQQVQNEIEEEERVLEMLDRMERERDRVRDYEITLAQQQGRGLMGTASANGSPTQLYPATRIGYAGPEAYQHHVPTRSRGHSFNSPSQPQLSTSGRGAPISRPSLPGPIQRPNFSSNPSSLTPPQLQSQLHGRRGSIEDTSEFGPPPGVNPYGNNIWGPPSSLSNRAVAGPPLVASPISTTPTANDDLDGRAASSRRQDSFTSTTAQKLARMLTTGSSELEVSSEALHRQRRSGTPPSPTTGVLNAGSYNLIPGPGNRATTLHSASTSTSSLNNPNGPPPLSAPTGVSTPTNGSTSTSSLNSTLSSRAPVFEPRRGGLGFGLKIFTGGGSNKVPNSNPAGSGQLPAVSPPGSNTAVSVRGGTGGAGRPVLGTGRPGAGNPGVIGAGRSGSGSSKS
ncbi:hypothetical protein BKA70DRAFT_200912 [Coprinopsis sp. MPI-PUGE-AT-0042]|nr:hypothetical protein BKA70DRAFT_200912 [Coprinopsis sp. MPI-PUGE-AT-0042]